MNDELEKIWRETVVAWLRNYDKICLEGLRKTTETVRIAGVAAEFKTKQPPTPTITTKYKSRALPLDQSVQ
jgi:hypothetical protein